MVTEFILVTYIYKIFHHKIFYFVLEEDNHKKEILSYPLLVIIYYSADSAPEISSVSGAS